jgi:hypothetical protein
MSSLPDPDLSRARHTALAAIAASAPAAREEAQVCRSVLDALCARRVGFDLIAMFTPNPAGDLVLRVVSGPCPSVPGWRVPAGTPPGAGMVGASRSRRVDLTATSGEFYSALAGGAAIEAPLRIGTAKSGLLVLACTRASDLDLEGREFAEAVAGIAGLALGQSLLHAASERQAGEHTALLDSIADLSSELELSRLLQAVLRRAVALVRGTGGELAIYEEDKQELVVVASHDIGGADSTGRRLAKGEGGARDRRVAGYGVK